MGNLEKLKESGGSRRKDGESGEAEGKQRKLKERWGIWRSRRKTGGGGSWRSRRKAEEAEEKMRNLEKPKESWGRGKLAVEIPHLPYQ
jgi:hypothetical protein